MMQGYEHPGLPTRAVPLPSELRVEEERMCIMEQWERLGIPEASGLPERLSLGFLFWFGVWVCFVFK